MYTKYKPREQKRPKRERYFGEPMDTGLDFRPKYICLNCRLVLRVPRIRNNSFNKRYACGTCGGYIIPIGPMFKSPPANTNRGKKAWKKIEKGISSKIIFYAKKRYEEYKERKNEL